MSNEQQINFPITDKLIVNLAKAKAGSYEQLTKKSGVSRWPCWRLLNDRIPKLRDEQRNKLIEYINGK